MDTTVQVVSSEVGGFLGDGGVGDDPEHRI